MTDEPVRLRDDPEVDAEVRRDLDHVANAPAVGFDLDAGLERLRREIGGNSSPPDGGGTSGGGAAGGGLGASGGVLVGAGVVVAVGIAIAAWAWPSESDRSPPRPEAEASPASVDVPPASGQPEAPDRGAGVAPPSAPPVPMEAEHQAVDGTPLPEATEEEPGAVAPTVRRSADPPRETTSDARLELEQMVRIRALLDTQPAAALALADRGQRRFPAGLFTEEREAHAVLALDRLGRAEEASRRARRFLARHPESSFAERVERIMRGR